MKKLHPFISFLTAALLLFLSANTLGQNCNYSWVQQNSGTNGQLSTVKAVSDSICWMGGGLGTICRTTNGGANWIDANPSPSFLSAAILNIEALDGNRAWVAASTTNGGTTFIYRTTNGGLNWQNVYSSSQTMIFGIKMINATSGFAFGNPSSNVWQMLVTVNGGQSWSLSPNAPPSQNIIETCLPNSFQVALPNIWWGTSITTVYRSTNSGLNFTSHEANVSGIYIQAIHYNSPELGLSSSISMSKSTNGGINYAGLPVPGAGNIEGIEGEGNNFWFVRGTGIYMSTNSGSSWTQVYTAAQSLLHMDFPDGVTGCQTGWAVGYGGVVYKLTSSVTGVNLLNSEVPVNYELSQNYPNPFNPQTVINFSIPTAGFTELKIYDILGNEVAKIVSGEVSAGNYSVNFTPSNIAGGVYFYTLTSGSFIQTKKMLIVK